MKYIIAAILVLLSTATVSLAGETKMAWPALKAVHTVISQTFHPSEEGNLVPVKARAKELYTKAQALSKSKIPAAYNNDQVKEAIANLEQEAKKLNAMVAGKESDEEIKQQLSVVHDAFHEVAGLCTKEGEEKEGE